MLIALLHLRNNETERKQRKEIWDHCILKESLKWELITSFDLFCIHQVSTWCARTSSDSSDRALISRDRWQVGNMHHLKPLQGKRHRAPSCEFTFTNLCLFDRVSNELTFVPIICRETQFPSLRLRYYSCRMGERRLSAGPVTLPWKCPPPT